MANYGGGSVVLQNLKIQTDQKRIFSVFIVMITLLSGVSTFARTGNVDRIFQDTTYEEESVERNPYFLSKDDEGAGMDSLIMRQVPERIINAYRSNEDYIYPARKPDPGATAERTDNKKPSGKRNESGSIKDTSERTWFQKLLWLLIIGGFLTFLGIWLTSSNIHLFRRSAKRVIPINEEESHEDIFSINYERDIDKAAAMGNYRLAIRLHFLRLLRSMAERNIIQYKQDYTNFDYLVQLSPTNYYEDFFRVTRDYEYSWYGQFEVKEESYKVIRGDFEKMESKLH
jgi:hypothetical protein